MPKTLEITFFALCVSWPIILAMLIRSRDRESIPSFRTVIARGYMFVLLSFVISFSFMYLYYAPLTECTGAFYGERVSSCISVPGPVVHWFAEWSYILTNSIGFFITLWWQRAKSDNDKEI